MDSMSMAYYKSDNFFKDKNIIITGASGGIGSVLVKTLCSLGANVIAFIRNEKKFLNIFKTELSNYRLRYEIIDFSTNSNIVDYIQKVMVKLGGRLDSLIMCHGVYSPGTIEDTGVDDFDVPMIVNVRSCLHLLSIATPFLKTSKGNAVIVSSLEAKIPTKGSFLNSVTKSMINSLIKCSALELASFGVRVNGVAPGVTNTRHRVGVNEDFKESQNQEYMEKIGAINLLNKQVLLPQDVANSVLFLASDDASFMTGEIIEIDNGYGLNHDTSFSDQTAQ